VVRVERVDHQMGSNKRQERGDRTNIEDIPTKGGDKEQYGEMGQVVKKWALNGQHSGIIPTEVQAEILK
jgi:hypothetical protein